MNSLHHYTTPLVYYDSVLLQLQYIWLFSTALSNQNSRTFQGQFVIFQGLKIAEVGSAIFGWIHSCPLYQIHVQGEKGHKLMQNKVGHPA